jgi:hypothetical protein
MVHVLSPPLQLGFPAPNIMIYKTIAELFDASDQITLTGEEGSVQLTSLY